MGDEIQPGLLLFWGQASQGLWPHMLSMDPLQPPGCNNSILLEKRRAGCFKWPDHQCPGSKQALTKTLIKITEREKGVFVSL